MLYLVGVNHLGIDLMIIQMFGAIFAIQNTTYHLIIMDVDLKHFLDLTFYGYPKTNIQKQHNIHRIFFSLEYRPKHVWVFKVDP